MAVLSAVILPLARASKPSAVVIDEDDFALSCPCLKAPSAPRLIPSPPPAMSLDMPILSLEDEEDEAQHVVEEPPLKVRLAPPPAPRLLPQQPPAESMSLSFLNLGEVAIRAPDAPRLAAAANPGADQMPSLELPDLLEDFSLDEQEDQSYASETSDGVTGERKEQLMFVLDGFSEWDRRVSGEVLEELGDEPWYRGMSDASTACGDDLEDRLALGSMDAFAKCKSPPIMSPRRFAAYQEYKLSQQPSPMLVRNRAWSN